MIFCFIWKKTELLRSLPLVSDVNHSLTWKFAAKQQLNKSAIFLEIFFWITPPQTPPKFGHFQGPNPSKNLSFFHFSTTFSQIIGILGTLSCKQPMLLWNSCSFVLISITVCTQNDFKCLNIHKIQPSEWNFKQIMVKLSASSETLGSRRKLSRIDLFTRPWSLSTRVIRDR